PLGLVALMAGHRYILHKPLRLSCALALMLLIIAAAATVGQWPERIGLLAIIVSAVGIVCSGLALVTGEAVPVSAVPSFVLAMQTILILFSALLGLTIERTTLAGQQGRSLTAIAVGAGIGFFVG